MEHSLRSFIQPQLYFLPVRSLQLARKLSPYIFTSLPETKFHSGVKRDTNLYFCVF